MPYLMLLIALAAGVTEKELVRQETQDPLPERKSRELRLQAARRSH